MLNRRRALTHTRNGGGSIHLLSYALQVLTIKMAVMSRGMCHPTLIKKNIDWAVKCFREWVSARNKNIAEGGKHLCPLNVLEKPDVEKMNYWISRFVAKVRNWKGEPYPSDHCWTAAIQEKCSFSTNILQSSPNMLLSKDIPYLHPKSSVPADLSRPWSWCWKEYSLSDGQGNVYLSWGR